MNITPFYTGFLKAALDRGLSNQEALAFLKIAQPLGTPGPSPSMNALKSKTPVMGGTPMSPDMAALKANKPMAPQPPPSPDMQALTGKTPIQSGTPMSPDMAALKANLPVQSGTPASPAMQQLMSRSSMQVAKPQLQQALQQRLRGLGYNQLGPKVMQMPKPSLAGSAPVSGK